MNLLNFWIYCCVEQLLSKLTQLFWSNPRAKTTSSQDFTDFSDHLALVCRAWAFFWACYLWIERRKKKEEYFKLTCDVIRVEWETICEEGFFLTDILEEIFEILWKTECGHIFEGLQVLCEGESMCRLISNTEAIAILNEATVCRCIHVERGYDLSTKDLNSLDFIEKRQR